MQLCKLFKCYSNHFLISLSISDLEILAKRVSVLYAVVHASIESREPAAFSLFPPPPTPRTPESDVCIPGRSQIWILNNFNFSVYEREKTIHLSDRPTRARRRITCHENICSAIPPTLSHSVHLDGIEGRSLDILDVLFDKSFFPQEV